MTEHVYDPEDPVEEFEPLPFDDSEGPSGDDTPGGVPV